MLGRDGALAGAALAAVAAHFRYLLESVGPELRQYIVTSNDEERPFARDQRRWVYALSSSTRRFRRRLRPKGNRARPPGLMS